MKAELTSHETRSVKSAALDEKHPSVHEEIVAVMRQAGDTAFGRRLRGLIVVLWRAGLRISEALALSEGDLEVGRDSVVVRRGKGGRRREVGMDDWPGRAAALA